jgi:lysozyme family protein
MRYASKWPVYAKQWDAMVIKAARMKEFTAYAQYAAAASNKKIYQSIEAKTNVPWPLIAVLHRRESDANFGTYLGNGDSLKRRTVHVPAGRGPFTGPNAFVNGAIDALKLDGLSSVGDWRLEKALWYAEIFNGLGYENHGLPSPYIWGGTNIQRAGKYVSDGVWSSSAWDSQPGCAPILYLIAKLDASVQYGRET